MKPAEFRGYTKAKLDDIETALKEIKKLVKQQNSRISKLEAYKDRILGWREALVAIVTFAVTAVGIYIRRG